MANLTPKSVTLEQRIRESVRDDVDRQLRELTHALRYELTSTYKPDAMGNSRYIMVEVPCGAAKVKIAAYELFDMIRDALFEHRLALAGEDAVRRFHNKVEQLVRADEQAKS